MPHGPFVSEWRSSPGRQCKEVSDLRLAVGRPWALAAARRQASAELVDSSGYLPGHPEAKAERLGYRFPH